MISLYDVICFVTAINGKRYHEFEREKGPIYGKVWKEEREGENGIIILQSQNVAI